MARSSRVCGAGRCMLACLLQGRILMSGATTLAAHWRAGLLSGLRSCAVGRGRYLLRPFVLSLDTHLSSTPLSSFCASHSCLGVQPCPDLTLPAHCGAVGLCSAAARACAHFRQSRGWVGTGTCLALRCSDGRGEELAARVVASLIRSEAVGAKFGGGDP